jgi:hypothetical protein
MKSRDWLKGLGTAYLVFANSIVLAFVVFAALFVAWWSSDESRRQGFSKVDYVRKMSPEARAEYGHSSDEDINVLLSETWNIRDGGWVFEPWTGFRERARAGRFVNVDEFGIRPNAGRGSGLAALNGAIWMFGGSTTFGYGVADAETIPAYLQRISHQDVVNLGRGYYYSAQENRLLRDLLVAGLVPSRVVFLDGINERCNIDVYQAEMGRLFDAAQVSTSWSSSRIFGPVKLFAYNVLLRLGGILERSAPYDASMMQRLSCSSFGTEKKLSEIVRANLIERKLVCQQYGLECTTFVQPFAGVHGIHVDATSLPIEARNALKGHYDALKDVFAEAGAVSLVEALDEKKTHAFVDNVHYSAASNALIARAIARYMAQAREHARGAPEQTTGR